MRLGFALPVAGPWATPANQVTIARAAEAHGYASVWTLQRLLMPAAPRDPYPGAPDGPWPAVFASVADPVVTLAHVAGATERVRLGTAVLNMPFQAPAVLAKQLATLDRVSGGRLDVGLGLGWSRDEFQAAGADFRGRGRRADEYLRCLTALWADGEVEFAGEFYRVPRSTFAPKPVQRPRPPLLVGGYVDASIRRAIRLGDGYIAGNLPLGRVAPLLARIGAASEAAGRDPAGLRVVCRGATVRHGRPQGPGRRPLFGTLDEIRADLARYAEVGLTELFLDLNFDPALGAPGTDPARSMDAALALLEQLAPGR